jgi:hypothetical protein
MNKVTISLRTVYILCNYVMIILKMMKVSPTWKKEPLYYQLGVLWIMRKNSIRYIYIFLLEVHHNLLTNENEEWPP